MNGLSELLHQSSELSQGLYRLAIHQGLPMQPITDIVCDNPTDLASYIGFESIAMDTASPQLMANIAHALPLMIRIGVADGSGYLLVQSCHKQNLGVLLPDRTVCDMPITALEELLSGTRIRAMWLLSPHPRLQIRTLLKAHRLRRYAVGFTLGRVIERLLFLASWWLLGNAILFGRFDSQIVLSWLLLLGTASFCKSAAGWCHIQFSTSAGIVLKKKMLDAILRQHPDRIRHFGAGQLLGRSLESEVLMTDTLSGIFNVILSLIDLVLAVFVLFAVSQFSTLLALIGWSITGVFLWYRFYFGLREWSTQRIRLSDHMVENIAGHATRQVQQHVENKHTEEDRYLEEYLRSARVMDNHAALLDALLPYGWLVLGSITLFLPLVQGAPNTLLASSVGAILLSWRAFQQSVAGGKQLIWGLIVWQHVKPLISNPEPLELPLAQCQPDSEKSLLKANGISYHRGNRYKPILEQLDFEVGSGDRIMLTGASGAGKSTLASIIAGLRSADTGQIVLHNRDCSTLGTEERRRRLCLVPQFQDNHIFTNSLAFNLLLGRNWPPSEDDLKLAVQLCRELGLMPLLEKMPSGLFQPVGEMGWKLSHGEKSRVFIARALLQNADLLIFDESLAALDPHTLTRSLACIEEHSKAVLLCAHP